MSQNNALSEVVVPMLEGIPDQVCVQPEKMQRVQGIGRIMVKAVENRSRLDQLFQEGAAKIRVPRGYGAGLDAVIINTAGGLTGGDELFWHCEAGADTALTVTTQACEKTYKAIGHEPARVMVDLKLGAGAQLAWLPQETILFNSARLVRNLNVDMVSGSRLLMVEPVILGRKAMGEAVSTGIFRDRWRVRIDGRLIHAEDTVLGEDIAGHTAHAVGFAGATAFATILCVAPDMADQLPAVRSIIDKSGDGTGGASAWSLHYGRTGKLLARVCAQDGYTLRKTLVPLLHLLTDGAGVPKIWSL